jgi:predicted transcriptional regulator
LVRPDTAELMPKEDILISIKPMYMGYIIDRTKNHEFRKYLIPNHVRRMWYVFAASTNYNSN